MTNAEFAVSDKAFQEACKRAGIRPTRRQASKWKLGFGKAFENRQHKGLDADSPTHINNAQ